MTICEELEALIAKIGAEHALLKARLEHAHRETFGAQDDSGDNTPPPPHP